MNRIVLKLAATFAVVVLLVLASMLYIADRAMVEQQRLVAAGDIRGALAAAGTAARYNPFSSEPYIAEASLLQNRGRSEDALEVLREAAQREPEDYTIYLSVANIELSNNNYEAAADGYRKVLELNPKASTAVGGLAQSLIRQGELREAGRLYERLEQEDKIDPLGLYDLGRIYTRTGRPEEGYKFINQARRRTEADLPDLQGAARDRQLVFIESMRLSAVDALVVQRDYRRAYRLLEDVNSDQAPGLLELISTDPEGYRESVINSEIY